MPERLVEVIIHPAKPQQVEMPILKKAFAGKLTPQGPNGEPVSLLLERTRAARANYTGKQSVQNSNERRGGARIRGAQ